MTAAALWDRLSAEGLVEGEMPEPGRPASPWYVRVMLGIAGWIGALFLLGFVGAAFSLLVDDCRTSPCSSEPLLCGGAFALFRAFDGNDFAEQFGLAVSLAGQMLMIVGLSGLLGVQEARRSISPIALIEAALALLVPNFLHRLLATCGAAVAVALAINAAELHGLSAPILCAGPGLWSGSSRRSGPAADGCGGRSATGSCWRCCWSRRSGCSAPEPCSAWWPPPSRWVAINGPLIGRALTAAVLLWVAVALVRREGVAPASPIGLTAGAAALVLGLASLAAPGLASALLILLLGFAVGNRILVALGNPQPARLRHPFLLQPARHPARKVGHIGGHRPLPARDLVRARAASRLPPAAADPGHA